MIRNRYNQIQHPALNKNRERDTHNQDGTKTKNSTSESQGDSPPNRRPQGYPKQTEQQVKDIQKADEHRQVE